MKTSPIFCFSALVASIVSAASIHADTKNVDLGIEKSADESTFEIALASEEIAPFYVGTNQYEKLDDNTDVVLTLSAEIEKTSQELKKFFSNNKFNYSSFLLVRNGIGTTISKAKNSVKDLELPNHLQNYMVALEKTYNEMSSVASKMNQWKSQTTPGAAEIFSAYELIAICLSHFEVFVRNDISIRKGTVEDIYGSVWDVAGRFYKLSDKQNMAEFKPTIERAFELVKQLRSRG